MKEVRGIDYYETHHEEKREIRYGAGHDAE